MQNFISEIEACLNQNGIAHRNNDGHLTFNVDRRGTPFKCDFVQNGDQVVLRVTWDVWVPHELFPIIYQLAGRMGQRGWFFGEMHEDQRDGTLSIQLMLYFHKAIPPGFVNNLLGGTLAPFAEMVDRLLQVMVGVTPADLAVESFAAWCRRRRGKPAKRSGDLGNGRGFFK